MKMCAYINKCVIIVIFDFDIENGRIYFSIKNEFEVALTLMGNSNDKRWYIVSLDLFVQATSVGGAAGNVYIELRK
jgi:hypothetical protein